MRIEWMELNSSYRDAVTITRKLGFHYLWIDSLCIVQDDQDDWAKESGAMASIYASSYLTICASRAKDGESGIFSDRQDTNKVPTEQPSHLTPWSATVSGQVNLEPNRKSVISARVLFKHYFHGFGSYDVQYGDTYLKVWQSATRDEEPLFTRAWAFQERILAKRTLDYHTHEIVWECQEMRRCECGETDRRGLKTQKQNFTEAFSQPPSVANTEQQAQSDQRHRQNVWSRLVEIYTTLALTVSNDRLPALSGLAQAMANANGDSYIAGLWEQDLPFSLLWYPSLTPRKIELERNDSFYRGYPSRLRNRDIPSWSWASLESPVIFPLAGGSGSRIAVAQVDDITAHALTSDPYGRCGKGRLTITGPFVEAKLKYNRQKLEKFWVSVESFWFPVLPDLDHSIPGTAYWLAPITDVYLLEVARYSSYDQESHGLILKAAGVEGDGTTRLYERLGTYVREHKPGELRLRGGKIVQNDIFLYGGIQTVVIV